MIDLYVRRASVVRCAVRSRDSLLRGFHSLMLPNIHCRMYGFNATTICEIFLSNVVTGAVLLFDSFWPFWPSTPQMSVVASHGPP